MAYFRIQFTHNCHPSVDLFQGSHSIGLLSDMDFNSDLFPLLVVVYLPFHTLVLIEINI